MGKPPSNRRHEPSNAVEGPGEVRVIGGRLRGSIIPYNGDPRVRPMKDRVREAVFNLIAVQVVGTHVIDLFAGTGAMSIEALSRGAVRATLFERHFPTAKQIQVALKRLDLDAVSYVLAGDAFFWGKRLVEPNTMQEGLPDGTIPWLVFVCPPYQLYVDRREDLKEMIASIVEHAPPGSKIVVESDERFDAAELCRPEAWLTRTYLPATISILRIESPSSAS